jgi:4-diphosphocytidyl-2-C-methyl-D-erythritol kinase
VRLHAQAPGKVNLCLFLGGLRTDGRHELVTVFESVSLADELTLSSVEGVVAEDEVVCPGLDGPNLVSSALAGLRMRGWDAPTVKIEIRKRIPVAAGMGGGSADAAAALRMAMELAPGRPEEVAALAASLGADVPSQLAPGLILGTGAGELVEPFEPLAPHGLLLLPAQQALSTADVYRVADRLELPRTREELNSCYERVLGALVPDARLSGELLVNDLQPAAVALCPPVAEALAAARAVGVDDVLVCGSGPTVAGVFWGEDGGERASNAAASLYGRFEGATAAVPVSADFGLPQLA